MKDLFACSCVPICCMQPCAQYGVHVYVSRTTQFTLSLTMPSRSFISFPRSCFTPSLLLFLLPNRTANWLSQIWQVLLVSFHTARNDLWRLQGTDCEDRAAHNHKIPHKNIHTFPIFHQYLRLMIFFSCQIPVALFIILYLYLKLKKKFPIQTSM